MSHNTLKNLNTFSLLVSVLVLCSLFLNSCNLYVQPATRTQELANRVPGETEKEKEKLPPVKLSELKILEHREAPYLKLYWGSSTVDGKAASNVTYEICSGPLERSCAGSSFEVQQKVEAGSSWASASEALKTDQYFAVRAVDPNSGATSEPLVVRRNKEFVTDFDSFSIGLYHACYLKSDDAYCWGNNSAGELGLGDVAPRFEPIAIPGATDLVALDAGRKMTCYVTSNNKVYCAGTNTYGQLGNGTTTDSSNFVQVTGITNAISVTARGDRHACALLSDGTVSCWGGGTLGQLGNGAGLDSLTPVAVSGLTNVTATESGRGNFTCALKSNGTVSCWGTGTSYQLGNGVNANSNVPVSVTGVTTATQIAVGHTSACARLDNGTITCWGANDNAKLGIGNTTTQTAPVQVTGISDATKVVIGVHAACAIRSTGGVRCWGLGAWSGETGNGDYKTELTPSDVTGITNATNIWRSDYSFFVKTSDNRIKTWGQPHYSVTGFNKDDLFDTPREVTQFSSSKSFATMSQLSCYIDKNDDARCVGRNEAGQLGNGLFEGYTITPSLTSTAEKYSVIKTQGQSVCGILKTTGAVKCWGGNAYGQAGNAATAHLSIPATFAASEAVSDIAMGSYHTCAILKSTGAVECSGYNTDGQLGDNTLISKSTPVAVAGLTGVKKVTGGANHTCAITSTDQVACWGKSNLGQVGNNLTANQKTPVILTSLGTVRDVSTYSETNCAVTTSDQVYCWGSAASFHFGTLLTTNSLVPFEIPGFTNPREIKLIDTAACVRELDGKVRCWGTPRTGKSGNTDYSVVVTNPVLKELPEPAASISGGTGSFCTRAVSGKVYCWGMNEPKPYEPYYAFPTPVTMLDVRK